VLAIIHGLGGHWFWWAFGVVCGRPSLFVGGHLHFLASCSDGVFVGVVLWLPLVVLLGCACGWLQYFTLPRLFHMESMEWRVEADGFHVDSMDFPDGFHIIQWNFQIIPWNFQMDSILFKSDLMPPQNSIQNSYVIQ